MWSVPEFLYLDSHRSMASLTPYLRCFLSSYSMTTNWSNSECSQLTREKLRVSLISRYLCFMYSFYSAAHYNLSICNQIGVQYTAHLFVWESYQLLKDFGFKYTMNYTLTFGVTNKFWNFEEWNLLLKLAINFVCPFESASILFWRIY